MNAPRKYQIEAIQRAIAANILIADDRGLGKTLEAIEAVTPIMRQWQRPVLIVCAKNLRNQWIEEIHAQETGFPTFRFDWQTEIKPFAAKPLFVVMHYEALVKYQKELAKTF